jgi:hypothetical protein
MTRKTKRERGDTMSVGGDVRNYLTKVGKQGNLALGFPFTNNIRVDEISPLILRNHVFSYFKNIEFVQTFLASAFLCLIFVLFTLLYGGISVLI